jgi:plastocyanin domain-containing protein
MKTLITTLALISLIGGAFAQHDMSKMKPGQKMPAKMGAQKVTVVVNNGFSPSTINVKAGQPVQLTFDTKHKSCISSVNFPGLKMKKDLADGKKTIFTFTPKKGSYAFACPMNMMKGKVIAK